MIATVGAAEYVGDWPAGSPEWVAARAAGLGGSEIAAAMGLSPWESRFSLWHRKTGLAASIAENDQMEWGKRLEPAIAAKYAELHPDRPLRHASMWRNRQRSWQIASPDRFQETDGPARPLELKTAWDDLGWGEPGTDEVPVYYRTQALWYCDALGVPEIDLAVLISGSDYREYVVTYAEDEALVMRQAAKEFLTTLQRGERPAIDAHSATYQVIREMHPDIDSANIDVPAEVAESYLDACQQYKASEGAKRQATAMLADAMGTAHGARYYGDLIAIRVPGRGEGNPPYVRAVPAKQAGQKVRAAS